ncbi:GNAT family N-acetyltransferase [Streptomyces sp. NBC_00201]|uniref:GNAT family N-acetyltransferase n=1 Tax=Streptomyces sp. NBC_00201 TaxID=2975679 RepID=UPI0022513976|nr:GNAT family N-acetyltransferase [Streptomyces sp. NBC_00201]MCX5246905.1 GNAT family N-acetyltransferase [Streptomyces sp. NBC_00201]
MGGDYVTESVAGCLAALRPAVERDWTKLRAAGLEWNCHETAVHIADDLIAYAANLAGRAQDAYVPFELKLDEGTDNAGLLHVIETTGALLAAAVRTAPREARAFHPYPFRSANREGFAAMGIAEVVLHTRDLAGGLGLAYEPPSALAEFVLTRLFPHVQPGPDHWRTLLWATGRGELPGRTPLTEWRWNNNLVLSADRLTLQGITPAAARDLVAGGDGGFEWIDGGPFDGTREASGFLLKAYEGGVHRPEFGVFALVRREDGRAIGGIGFHGAPDEEGRAEIGYDLVEGGRGNGYATEALRALSQWALARDDVRTLFATVERDNLPSQAVVTRAGFRKVSEVEEGLAYELRD